MLNSKSRSLLSVVVILTTLLTTSLIGQTAPQAGKVDRGRVVVEGMPTPQPSARPTAPPSRPTTDKLPAAIPDAEFWRMISEFSEPGGSYPYENFVSNEWNQQKVIPGLKNATRNGEVYIGVGPEQNFTYAAALQAKMAFVVDIRRQNMLEHLLYKALFELSPNRADFVSRLFSRKRPAGLDDKTSASALFAAYENLKNDADFYVQNLEAVKSSFKRHGYQLSSEDIIRIEFVYQVFFRGGPAINYGFASATPAVSTPTYTQLVAMADEQGRNWSYLATEEAFQHVREMQRKNLFVPLVGDFAGPNAIRNIAKYLKEQNANVSAFYASNVETYLDERQTRDFYGNLLSLPTDSTTTVIRFVDRNRASVMPWWNPSMEYTQAVSPMSDLVNLARGGSFPAYTDIIRLIKDPSSGGIVPRFVLPAIQGPGRPFLSLAVNPQASGAFEVLVPVGTVQIGAPTGLPATWTVKSITYGSVDLLKQSMTVAPSDTAQLVITLTR